MDGRGACKGAKFPVGALVRLVDSNGFPPEGFHPGCGFEVLTIEVPAGAVGVVVNPPSTRYALSVRDQNLMIWILVDGQLIEMPNIHLRRLL